MVSTEPQAGSPAEPLVRIEELVVRFGRNDVLRRLDLSIPRGQTLAVIGESGCGKTVLLKAIIGLLHPAAGTVYFDGQDIYKLGEKALTRARIRFGFLFQQAALFDSMTVAQNVAFGLEMRGRARAEEKFSLSAMARKNEQLYLNLLRAS